MAATIHAPGVEPKQRKSIEVNYEYGNWIPNWIMRPDIWQPDDGGRPPSVYALLCYMWLVDKVTSGHEEDGTPIGEVLGGKPIGYSTIARNLGVAWRTVQRQMSYLADIALLIRRTQDGESGRYSFEVLDCDKWKYLDGKQADGTVIFKGKKYTKRETTPNKIEDDNDDFA
jgi:hypothetical protein